MQHKTGKKVSRNSRPELPAERSILKEMKFFGDYFTCGGGTKIKF
jgi:hypothetical protein